MFVCIGEFNLFLITHYTSTRNHNELFYFVFDATYNLLFKYG